MSASTLCVVLHTALCACPSPYTNTPCIPLPSHKHKLQASGLVDPADAAAAGFYALNLYNTWTNNAASGGFFAYSFPVLSTPLNLFRNWTWFDPGARPFKLFDNNVGHSTGYLW